MSETHTIDPALAELEVKPEPELNPEKTRNWLVEIYFYKNLIGTQEIIAKDAKEAEIKVARHLDIQFKVKKAYKK